MGSRGFKLAGFAAFTGILTLVIGAAIAGFTTADRITLTANFEDATGLRPGDDVRISGVPVGSVRSVELGPTGLAEVELRVNRDVVIPADSQVSISWLNLIGQRQIDILLGESQQVLADGEGFTASRSVVDLMALSDKLTPFARALSPTALNELFETVFVTLDGNEANVAELIGNLEVILTTVGDRDATLGRLVEDAEAITGALAARDEQIARMIDNLVLVAETFADSTDLIAEALDQGAGAATDLSRFITTNDAELRRFIDALAIVADYSVDRLDLIAEVVDEVAQSGPPFFTTGRWGDFLNVRIPCVFVGDAPTPMCTDELPPLSSLTTPASFADLLLGRPL